MPGFSSVGTFKIFIGNLADKTTGSDIKPLFEKYGKVVECDVVKNYGFVVSDVTLTRILNRARANVSDGDEMFVRPSTWRTRKPVETRYKI